MTTRAPAPPKAPPVDRVLDSLDGVLLGHGDGHALAERQTIRLDNDRRTVLHDVLDRVREFSKTA